MSVFSIFLTGIGLAMDAFAVSLAKGMTIRKNLLKNALKISLFFGGFQALMPLIGWLGGTYFKEYIEAFSKWIAFILLVSIGGKMIFEFIKENKQSFEGDAEEELGVDSEEDEENELSNKSIILLAIATSIDALAVGVSFAFLNVNIFLAIAIIGIVTFILCFIAIIIGKKISGVFSKYAEPLGGVILVLIGFKILF